MNFVSKDTYQEITGLNLAQKGSYFVIVVGMSEGGQCNSSTSHFTVDITPPVEGRLRAGPFYDMVVTYTDSTESIHIVWEDYVDEESGIKSFNIRLLEAASCDRGSGVTLTPVPNQEWLVLGPNISEFTFVDLSLEANHPYFVQLLAVNHAGNSTKTKVGPIFVDTSEPTAGLVVDGPDFMIDLTDSNSRHQVTGTILHRPDPVGPPCPLRDISFTDSQWLAIDFKGLWNMESDNWDLEYHNQQVYPSNDSVTVKMERDTRGPRMLSGAYSINAQIVRSSEYEFDLMAASPDLHSVTNILFWDGPERVVGEYDFRGPDNWQEGICECCYAQPFNQSACPQCDCQDFIGVDESTDGNSTFASTTYESVTTATDDATANDLTPANLAQVTSTDAVEMTTTQRPWTIQKLDEDGDNISDDESGRWITQRACGLQLYPNGNASEAVLWCRHYEDEWPMTSDHVNLDFDPSEEEHHYSIQFRVMPFDADEDEWSFEVYIDGKLLSSLTGIPVMTSSAKLILHVFNRDNYLADLQDPFNPPSVTATMRNLRMPPDASMLCRYGLPFRAGTSPVSRYFAGIGTVAGATDIVAYEEVSRPCVPCINPCDHYQCDPLCTMDDVPITFTLTNLNLPRLELLNMTSNSTNATTPTSREDGLLYPFFLTVKSVLGNGKLVTASSNGFYIDDTPADLDVFFYVDVNLNDYEPVSFQSSNTTIKVLWSFIDIQSMVKEHHWAIGTSRGATDLQDFVNVGFDQTATNNTTILHHNTTYYVTLKCVNGAGLETLVECDGVTVLLEEPTANDVNTTSMFSKKFEEEVYPPDIEKSDDPTKTGTSWSKPEDESINRYEYCVSSSAELREDVVPCMVVGTNSSGSVSIEGGFIIVRAGEQEERYNITDFQASREDQGQKKSEKAAKFNMEPGKCLHTWMRMCNPARICVTLSAGTTTVLGGNDMMMTSANGTDLVLTPQVNRRRRRKRTVDRHFDLSVATTGGLHQGGSLILGLLDGNKTNEEFTSDANPDYKSYITNPLYTIQQTSRLLRKRIVFVYEPPFYMTSLGQTELQGPMIINVTLNTPGNWTVIKPRLIYWDSDNSEWRDVSKTCSDVDRITYNQDMSQLTVEVCATRDQTSSTSDTSRKRRATVEGDPLVANISFFSHETEFALAEVLNTIPNEPPEITNLVDNFVMDEDEGTLKYTFLASDPEDDTLVFELGPDEMTQGTAAITEDGVFTFTPCADCHGTFTFQFIVREVQTVSEIDPLTITVGFSVEVRPVNDNPVSYVALNGQAVGNGRDATLTVEQDTGSNIAYNELVAVIGAYDVDINDNLMLSTRPPTYGVLTLKREVRSVPKIQDCSAPSSDSEDVVVPCGLELPQDVEEMSWVSSTFTYTPNPNYHGKDSFLVLATDKSGSVSQRLRVEIAVLVNPCINNGVCGGPVEDPDCSAPDRSSGFESYFCVCESGWVGDNCETDYDECQSTPCEYPYVCYDHLNTFECACPLSDPLCDGLHWRFKLIIAITCTLVVLFAIAVVVFYIYKKKYTKKMVIHHCPDDEDQLSEQHDNSLNPASEGDNDIQDGIKQGPSSKRLSSAVSAHSPVSQSSSHFFVNPAFEGDNDIQDGIKQGPSPERSPSAISIHSTVSKSSFHSDRSSHSHDSDGKKPDRPRARLAPPVTEEASVHDAETSKPSHHESATSVPQSSCPLESPVTAEKRAGSTMHAGSSGSLKDHVEVSQSPGSPKEKASRDIDSPVTTQKWVETTMPTGSSGSLKDDMEAADGEDRLIFQKKSPSSPKEQASCEIELPGSPVSIQEDDLTPQDIEETVM